MPPFLCPGRPDTAQAQCAVAVCPKSLKVQNWPAYEPGLQSRRGSLLLWIEGRRVGPLADLWTGRAARQTDATIQTSLMLRAAFKLPLRQTEGLLASVLTLMDLTISTPDHTTVSRRAGDVAGDPVGAGAPRSVARADRQHRLAGLRSGSMAGGETWREVAPANGASYILQLMPPAA